jgi:alkaline phosphatase D
MNDGGTHDTPTVTRRQWVAATGGLAAVIALGQLPGDPASAAPRRLGYPFTLGVASGEPLPGGVVLWTRLAPEPLAPDGLGGMPNRQVSVTWQLATDDAMRNVVRSGVALALPELAHSVHAEVDGLLPGRDYWYRFVAGSHASAIGHTRTAPAPGSSGPLALGFASCQQWEAGFFTAYRDMATQDLDAIVHLGDYIYEYGIGATGGARALALPAEHRQETMTLEQYRLRYSLVKTDPDLQAAHAAAPWLVSSDDHDVEDNYADETSRNGLSPEDMLRRRAAAYRAFYENLPLRAASMPQGPDMQMYRRVHYGETASLFVLDTRQYRDPLSIEERDDPRRSILGETQEQWLLDGLGASTTRWNLVVQQVMVAQLDRLTDPGLQQLNPDTWDGYAASRDRLLDGIVERGVRNPVVLTGDAHVNCGFDLKSDFNDPDSPTVAAELVATSISSGGNGSDMTPGGREWLAANPHLKFFNNQRGYVRCRIESEGCHADYRVVDRVSDPNGSASTRTTLTIEDGVPGLQAP